MGRDSSRVSLRTSVPTTEATTESATDAVRRSGMRPSEGARTRPVHGTVWTASAPLRPRSERMTASEGDVRLAEPGEALDLLRQLGRDGSGEGREREPHRSLRPDVHDGVELRA